MTVTSAPGTSSPVTLVAASTGYQSFATAYGANATVDVLISNGTDWEVQRGATYTHSGTTVSRGTPEASSNSGSLVNFSSATNLTVEEIATAGFGNSLESALQAVTPGGRLTLESGVPVSTTDQTAKSDLWYTPYVHNIINLWDGANWVPTVFTETKVTGASLTGLTSGKLYDVFAYLNSGALALELGTVWTSNTARASGSGGISLQDGRYCKGAVGSEDKTRLLVGTFYTTSTTTTEDSNHKRLVGNVYNTVMRGLYYESGSAFHSYSSGTRRYWNNTGASRLDVVLPLGASLDGGITSNLAGTNPRVEMGLNSETSIGFLTLLLNAATGYQLTAAGSKQGVPGLKYLAAIEVSAAGGDYDYLVLTGSCAL